MTHQLRTLAAAVGLTAVLLTALPSAAGVVSYSSSAAFQAAVATSASDGFDDLGAAQTLSAVSRSNAYQASVLDTTGAGPGGTDFFTVDAGNGNVWLSTAVAGNAMVFSGFDASVRGIGGSFFGTDVDGQFKSGQSFTLTLLDVLGGTSSYAVNNVTDRTAFFGLVSSQAISSLTVLALQGSAVASDPYSYNYATVDNLVVGRAAATALPEPASLALAGLALGVAGLARRRR